MDSERLEGLQFDLLRIHGSSSEEDDTYRRNLFGRIDHRIDHGQFKGPKIPPIMTVRLIGMVDWKRYQPPRAGIIPYKKNPNGELVFMLGQDSKYRTYTDFGGGVVYSDDKTAVRGGIREFHEETLGIFRRYFPEKMDDFLAIFNGSMLIMFVEIPFEESRDARAFIEAARNREKLEINDLIFLTKDELLHSNGRVYYKVDGHLTNALQSHGDFFKQL